MKGFFAAAAVCMILFTAGCRSGRSPDAGMSLRTESFESGPYRLEMSFPEEQVEFGSSVEINLKLEYPESESYILLPFEKDGSGGPSNLVIRSVSESTPVADGNGRLSSSIKIRIEAFLPGIMVFPAMTVRFGNDIVTDEIVFNSVSAFDASEQPKEFAPLYIPEFEDNKKLILITGISAAALVTAVIIVIPVRKKLKRHKSAGPVPQKTREELIADFSKYFTEDGRDINLREAFTGLEKIYRMSPPGHPAVADHERLDRIFNEARFSKEGITHGNGIDILKTLYDELRGGGE